MRALLLVAVIFVAAAAIGAEKANDAAKSFNKLLADRIGRRWYAQIEAQSKQLSPGRVHIHLVLSRAGKVRELRVVSNTSNDLSARLSLDSIRRAVVPSIPAEALTDGEFKTDYTFTVYAH